MSNASSLFCVINGVYIVRGDSFYYLDTKVLQK